MQIQQFKQDFKHQILKHSPMAIAVLLYIGIFTTHISI
ncbi:hypothetical protein MMIC_P0203 [Mariprofundus micogutta]|uniref:Uncharacterized protein n=1 Tax=Mariprofundus micogutta TaxID=1921010 RepID=A0A1L8CK37_9PROT|nr:hypothetical protein MMIC_P0203 [Mariprofundus micogutta]